MERVSNLSISFSKPNLGCGLHFVVGHNTIIVIFIQRNVFFSLLWGLQHFSFPFVFCSLMQVIRSVNLYLFINKLYVHNTRRVANVPISAMQVHASDMLYIVNDRKILWLDFLFLILQIFCFTGE